MPAGMSRRIKIPIGRRNCSDNRAGLDEENCHEKSCRCAAGVACHRCCVRRERGDRSACTVGVRLRRAGAAAWNAACRAGGAARRGAPPPPDTEQHTVPGSDVKMTRQQIGNRFNVGDWFPNDHPKTPYVVQYGKAPDVWACGLCHLVNGKGRPENASVSGLPGRVLPSAARRLQKRSAEERRFAQGQHERDDDDRKGYE